MLWIALLGQSSLFHFVKLLKLKNVFTSIASKNKLLVKCTDSMNSGNTSQLWGPQTRLFTEEGNRYYCRAEQAVDTVELGHFSNWIASAH